MFIAPEKREESVCSCKVCQEPCRRSPCFPTPEEAMTLINRGYGPRLAIGEWHSLFFEKRADVYTVVLPLQVPGGCTFLQADGRCELHDVGLKPLEGRLAHHAYADSGLRAFVARKWVTPEGVQAIIKFAKDEDWTIEEVTRKFFT